MTLSDDMAKEEEFFWLELKPQQKFKDDEENMILDIIQHASEFTFFVFRERSEMKMIVRTTNDQNLFKTIPGITTEPIEKPHFEKMITKYLMLKNNRSMIPLVDLKSTTKSNLYSKLWTEQRGCMMACFVWNQTKKTSSEIDRKINALERRAATKGVTLSGRDKAELAAAKQRREGHGYYNCTIVFGVQTSTPELSELKAKRRTKLEEERKILQSRIKNLKSLDRKEFRKENGILHESYKDTVKKIQDDFRADTKTVRDDTKETISILDKLVSNVLLNSFAHRIATHRVKLSFGKKSFRQKLAEAFGIGIIDPYAFVPKKLHSKSMVLTEIELAFFASLPQEHDVQTINFGIGPTPTFVHGQTQEIGKTDLTIQRNHDG
ncbi:MAG: hypothetical protein ACREBA_00430 [Nitrosotalea sp.]